MEHPIFMGLFIWIFHDRTSDAGNFYLIFQGCSMANCDSADIFIKYPQLRILDVLGKHKMLCLSMTACDMWSRLRRFARR